MDDVRRRGTVELARRVAGLPEELARWSARVAANQDGFGIHTSQVQAIERMMADLSARLTSNVDKLKTTGAAEYAAAYLGIVDELAAVDDVWSVFGAALYQRSDAELRARLDVADLVAAGCYLPCLERAHSWGATPAAQLRPPPLVLLESGTTPAAVSKGETLELLGHAQRRYRDLRLTIPLVLLQRDHIHSSWLLCTVYHEVGHNLDADLALRAELKKRVLTLALGPRETSWWRWTGEILADAFGVLFGGAGFVDQLGRTLLIAAPDARFATLVDGERHPNPHLRLLLLCALLDQYGEPSWRATATALRTAAQASPAPAWVDDYRGDVGALAATFLDGKLDALNQHTLRELVAPLAPGRLDEVRDHLRFGAPADPASPRGFLGSFVELPAAARLAASAAADPAAELATIEQRARAFAARIPRPTKLATTGPSAEILAKISRELDLRTPEPEEDPR